MSDLFGVNVSLLLHLEGSNGSTSFPDSSAFAKTVSAQGGAQISVAHYPFGSSSAYFDGIDDALSAANSSGFDFGSGDLTIEAWVYIAANSVADAGGDRSASVVNTWGAGIVGWTLSVMGNTSTTGTGLAFDTWTSGSGSLWRATTTVSQGVWHHLAVAVSAGTRYLFLDGVLQSGSYITVGGGYLPANAQGNSLNIGKTPNSSYPLPLNGYIKDLRITKGIARYTSDFTPVAAPFDDPPPPAGIILNTIARRDVVHGGGYRIYGTAKRLGAFTQRQVILMDRKTRKVIRETISDPVDGSYSFDYIAYRYRGYIVMELDWPPDRSDPLNAAVADLQTPVLMP